MNEYIRRLHQLFENFDALLRFYVKSKALLVAVKPHEGRAQTPRRGIPLSGYIADAWPLDLYHFSSKIREQCRAHGTAHALFNGDYLHPFQRKNHLIQFKRSGQSREKIRVTSPESVRFQADNLRVLILQ